MRSIIVRKRTLLMAALVLLGAALLLCGKSEVATSKKNVAPGRPVESSAAPKDLGPQESASVPIAGERDSVKIVQDTSDFFVNYRLDRERARGQRVEWVREVINSAGTAGETRQKAQEHLLAISRSMEKEVELENLIRARGYDDAAVLVDDRSVTVVVAAASLAPSENTLITEMVMRSTGVDAQNILIIRKN